MKKPSALIGAVLVLSMVLTACAPIEGPATPSEGAGAKAPSEASEGADVQEPAATSDAADIAAPVVSDDSSPSNFRLLVSDEANDIGHFSELWVLVSGVGFVQGDEEGTVEYPFETPVQLDLVPLVEENAIVLWEGRVPEGTYHKVFLYVDETYGVAVGAAEGETLEVKLPSDKLQVDAPVTIEDGDGGELTEYVFDVSVHQAGNSGMYILKPQLTESGQGKQYRLLEQTEERVRTGKPDWAGKPGGAGKPDDEDDQGEGLPSIEVTKEAEAVEGAVLSTVTITNAGDVDVTVVTVTDTAYWQVRGGQWQSLDVLVDETGYTIAAGDSLTLDYEIPCDVPAEARELRNVVEVVVEGRDRVFRDIVSFAPFGYMQEIEFEGVVDTLDPLTITTDQGATYIVVTDAETDLKGELVQGAPVEVEGVLQTDGTVLASEIKVTDIDD